MRYRLHQLLNKFWIYFSMPTNIVKRIQVWYIKLTIKDKKERAEKIANIYINKEFVDVIGPLIKCNGYMDQVLDLMNIARLEGAGDEKGNHQICIFLMAVAMGKAEGPMDVLNELHDIQSRYYQSVKGCNPDSFNRCLEFIAYYEPEQVAIFKRRVELDNVLRSKVVQIFDNQIEIC